MSTMIMRKASDISFELSELLIRKWLMIESTHQDSACIDMKSLIGDCPTASH